MAESIVPEGNDRDWESHVERNKKPVLVMFFSPTCPHCRQMEPVLEDLAREYSQSVDFMRLNIIRFTWLAERYGVMATPTFLWFCGGKSVQSRVGAVLPAMLKKMVEEMVQHGEECRMRSTDIDFEISGYG